MPKSQILPQKLRYLDPCPGCGRCVKYCARGLCKRCYSKAYPTKRRVDECVSCGRRKKVIGYGMCGSCYNRKRRSETPKKTCAKCDEISTIVGRGMCQSCYMSWRYWRRKGTTEFTCPDCNKERLHYALGRCRRCWMRMGEGHQHHRTKKKLEARDGLTCRGCRREFDYDDLTIDHVWPRKHADTYPGDDLNELSNLQLMCITCNSRKSDTLPPQAQMALPTT